jgi:hypothetical protein
VKLFVLNLSGKYAAGMALVSARDAFDAVGLAMAGDCPLVGRKYSSIEIASLLPVKATASEPRGIVHSCVYEE